MAQAMRGLTMFISDIRNCTTKDQEIKRVDKELAHIRQQFASRTLDGYQKKKYVWKLVYLYMLGYDIDFGHMEAQQLISSNKYTEKTAGYIACSVFFNENNVLLRLIIQSIKKDLTKEPVNEVHQCLALATIANLGGQEFAESLTPDVQGLLLSPASRSFVKKKSALALLRLFRKYPEVIPTDNFQNKCLALLEDDDIGVQTAIMSLLLGLVSHSNQGYDDGPGKVINTLHKLVFSKERKSVYRYYLTLSPWLQVKILRFLQYFPPPSEKSTQTKLNAILMEILTKTTMTKNVNKNNGDHSILFEALNLIIHHCVQGYTDLHGQAVGLLGKFIQIKEPNFRYLGLETMARLSRVENMDSGLKKHQNTIQFLLKDPDVSIRKRALDLLYVMCDKTNATEIVAALLKYLPTASFEMREELVLKVAILAEKFPPDHKWYIDVILQMLRDAGDFVSDDIWYRVVQIVTNNDALQDYAAATCYKFLLQPAVHENAVKIAAYVIGEFGHRISDKSITGDKLLDALQEKFKTAHNDTKALLMNAFIKMANTYPALKNRVDGIFKQHLTYADLEVQQRACEYFAMNSSKKEQLVNKVFEVMPDFPERKSALESKVRKRLRQTTDRDIFTDGGERKTTNGEDDEGDEEEDEEEDGEDGGEADGDVKEGQPSSQAQGLSFPGAGVKSAPKAEGPGAGSNQNTKTTATADPLGLGDMMSALGASNNNSTQQNGDKKEDDPFAAFQTDAPSVTWPEQAWSNVLSLLRKEPPVGALYDCKHLQIGYKAQIENGYSCKMVLYYGNRLPGSLTEVTAVLPESENLKVQARPTEPLEVKAGAQVLHYFLWSCRRPFTETPQLTIKFKHDGRTTSLGLKVPLLLTSFCLPSALSAQDFLASWKQHAGNEVLAVRKLAGPADSKELQTIVSTNAHMALIADVEKTGDNFVAAANFHTATKDPSGNFVTIPVLLRVETKPGMNVIRVSIHSGHKQVSDATLYAITTLFGATE